MKIAILGATGQLGAAVVHECSPHHDVTAIDHAALEITDAVQVATVMARLSPDVIINCVGYNAVDAAEDQPVEALQTNSFAVRTLARASAAHRTILVHYSSDFVFDGHTTRPYTEEDRPNPRSVYATSKMLGEWFAAEGPRTYVLRVESLFGRAPDGRPEKGSAAVILNALRSGTVARVFEDRTVSPTYVFDAAHATRALIERGAPQGFYHCVNSGHCTWLDFAREAARLLEVEPKLERLRLSDLKSKVERPRYCALANDKLVALGITMPTWQDALGRYLKLSIE